MDLMPKTKAFPWIDCMVAFRLPRDISFEKIERIRAVLPHGWKFDSVRSRCHTVGNGIKRKFSILFYLKGIPNPVDGEEIVRQIRRVCKS